MSTKTILVVEDDVPNAMLIVTLLRISGFRQTIVCASGHEADQYLEDGSRFDLVLLDLQLRGESGYQILTRLRQNPGLTGIPIVAVTAQVMPDEIAHAAQAGFDGFLGKPLNFDHFPDQIGRLLAGERVWEPR